MIMRNMFNKIITDIISNNINDPKASLVTKNM